MNEETLRSWVKMLGQMSDHLEVVNRNVERVEAIREDLLITIEKVAEQLGINPYEVKEF